MPILERKICDWMAEALEEDKEVATCTRTVLQRVKAAGLGEALLDAYGHRMIGEVWREYGGDDDPDDHDQSLANGRMENLSGIHRFAEQPAATPHHVATAASNQVAQSRGVRWMDVKQLASEGALVESLYQVDGNWIRLGDLNKRQCRLLQRQYGAAADAFGQLASGLAAGQIVRQRWTAKDLENLVGDILRAAAPARPSST